MAIVINGSGTVTGLAVGGLPDATVDSGTLASGIDKTSITDGGNATAITIDSAENVGVGVTPAMASSSYNGLHIGATYPTMKLSSTATGHAATDGFHLRIDSTPRVEHWNYENSSQVFATNNAARLEITADGRGLSQFTAKAWVNWDNTGTIGINDSHNVSSVTDNGTGNTAVVLANNMGNALYFVSLGSQRSGGAADDACASNTNGGNRTNGIDVHTVRLYGGSNNNAYWDLDNNFALLFGD